MSSIGNGKPNLNGIGMTSQRTRERLLGRLIDQGINSMEVLDVIRSTPRHIFLDEALSHRAYEDVALPIGHNQTISQPYVVAKMTDRKSTRLNSSHITNSYAVFCLNKKKNNTD